MTDIEFLKSVVKNKLPERRYIHSLGVFETAINLAKIYNVCEKKAGIAAILHDYAKYLSKKEARHYIKKFHIKIDEVIDKQIDLAHGLIAAELVKREFKIVDIDILNSIKYHTIARVNMTDIEKIIYLADYIEPNREFPGVNKIRNVALYNLDKAMIMALDNSIKYVIEKGLLLHTNSILARNSLILSSDKS
ncbi:bis(5'-nucleosyl)-tetraphosphatase (symmetrical) YqeK [Paramaledivibacter caminithermalis]|uniref:bis(5'-nucleosyl)-tetraphosphatase (symmetrical) n=1 Tax=Paramaledivibacter caminithermalis (strain DSM 15212 / CIP 107654 / DViRD3) TaxID=1121301 RepID=A0A1M6MGK5_PARC5|nr:bis(5'-nucleosyl)-tetraphosphatase (symmetrical) YqeK [Paramaledivibacter caminithermalis]SHJ82463.1 putative HD superfamily hydrolase of NAD metabolism [Paramaledivibacter caminithermalis DSM 15212]